jgi:hypothetical protein
VFCLEADVDASNFFFPFLDYEGLAALFILAFG